MTAAALLQDTKMACTIVCMTQYQLTSLGNDYQWLHKKGLEFGAEVTGKQVMLTLGLLLWGHHGGCILEGSPASCRLCLMHTHKPASCIDAGC